jgi:hypothetical protein
MIEHILILVIYSGGPAITSILYPSEEACKNAIRISSDLATVTSRVRAVCIPRTMEKPR